MEEGPCGSVKDGHAWAAWLLVLTVFSQGAPSLINVTAQSHTVDLSLCLSTFSVKNFLYFHLPLIFR